MGILDGLVSQDDINSVSESRNTPEFESGFGDDSGWDNGGSSSGFDDLNDLFGDDDAFGGSSSSSFGSSSSGFGDSSGFGSSSGFGDSFGSSNSFGGGFDSGFGGSSFGGGFDSGFGSSSSFGGFGSTNSFGGQTQQQPAKPDLLDKALDKGGEAATDIGKILLEMAKTFKNRTADDIAYLSTNLIKVVAIFGPLGLVLIILGGILNIPSIAIRGLGGTLLTTGLLSAGIGITGLGTCAIILDRLREKHLGSQNTVQSIPDEPEGDDNFSSFLDSHDEEVMDDVFSNEADDDWWNTGSSSDDDDFWGNNNEESNDEEDDKDTVEVEQIDYGKLLEEVNENQVMSRETLFNTFAPLLPLNTLKFAERTKLDSSDDYWKVLDTICLKALANLTNLDIEEISKLTHIESIEETKFAYEVKLKRINKVKNPDDLAREVQCYFETDDNENVITTAVIHGDFYKIIVTKGENNVITLGDALKLDYCKEFFLDKKKKLPIINGITELGKVELEDAKDYHSVLISGQSRSGKSWNLLNMLMQMMIFNEPYDVSFILVDPKRSNLFNTLSLMPHVVGLHTEDNIMNILNELIEIEAPRRKDLLSNHKCDDIWALRNKGIKLPVLNLVIDEYLTVVESFGTDKEKKKEFDMKIRTVLSQMPSLGIRIFIIPHRTTGVVDKTNRILFHYIGMVRANNKEIEETLNISKWRRTLTSPGDMAIMTSLMREPAYLKSAALTTSDEENVKLIEVIAKAFYKMGVEIPDYSNLLLSCNRNEEDIKERLSGGNVIQYDADNIFKDMD